MSVALSSGDTSEGTVAPAALTFTAATWNVAQTVTVTGVNDAVADGDQTYAIVTAAATSSDAAYNGFNATDVSVTTTDDDAVGITVSTISGQHHRGRRRRHLHGRPRLAADRGCDDRRVLEQDRPRARSRRRR